MLEWGGCGPVSTLLPLSFSSEPVGPTDTVADKGCCCCWLESLASSSLSRALASSRVSWREGGEGEVGGGGGGGGGGGVRTMEGGGRMRRVHSVGHRALLGCLWGGTPDT